MTPHEQGYAAYAAGLTLADNPYPAGSADAALWAMGWNAADDAANGRG